MHFKKIVLALVFLWFAVGGICHFWKTSLFVLIVPPYIPYPHQAVYISGFFELLGALGLLIPRIRPLAGVGLILLTLAVTPANVYMWQNPQLFPSIPPVLLSLRLVMQVFLLLAIAWGADISRLGKKSK